MRATQVQKQQRRSSCAALPPFPLTARVDDHGHLRASDLRAGLIIALELDAAAAGEALTAEGAGAASQQTGCCCPAAAKLPGRCMSQCEEGRAGAANAGPTGEDQGLTLL